MLEYDAAFGFLQIASLPKENGARGRTVVITQGALPTVVASEGKVSSCISISRNSACFVHLLDLFAKEILCWDVASAHFCLLPSICLLSVWHYLQPHTPLQLKNLPVLSYCVQICPEDVYLLL